MPDLPGPPYPGDDLLPTATMVYDQTRIVNANASSVWPWLIQIGKGRGGWYCPSSWEKWMPAGWQASHIIESRLQSLTVGDRVEDYGFSQEDYFDVAAIEPEKALVYRSERYGASFSWSLLLHELEQTPDGRPRTLVHLRFRGKIAAQGVKEKFLIWAGGLLDHMTTAPLLQGLAERVEKAHVE